MEATYPKSLKLKKNTEIQKLFSEGKSVSKYPLRLVFVPLDNDSTTTFGVSVSKKYFKHATDRNYFKRVLRETFRKNKHVLLDPISNTPYAFMFFYQTKDKLSYTEIEEKTKSLFEKFISQLEKSKQQSAQE
ncbi:MAG: ribonuclease P protein component [Flavobacterium sp.]|nr:ribonuclease P protein component [Candidatus Neoflavobacterium equi]